MGFEPNRDLGSIRVRATNYMLVNIHDIVQMPAMLLLQRELLICTGYKQAPRPQQEN